MLCAWWYEDRPWSINISEDDCPLINRECGTRPAFDFEIDMYKQGISVYKICNDGKIKLYQ